MEQKEVQLTQHALDKLKEELAFREGEKRAKIVEAIATARAHGDLSENAEYHAAREEQGKNEGEVRRIRQMLENAVVIGAGEVGVVQAGKLVTIRTGSDEPETYLLGHREEKRDDYDVLTPESPIGQVLLGKRSGEKVTAATPRGDIELEIVDVRAL